MNLDITIGYITARANPQFKWFLWSLLRQMNAADRIHIIVVDALKDQRELDLFLDDGEFPNCDVTIKHTLPMPNIWNGPHRVTNVDWWANSAARNTALCLAKTKWIAFLDDRCVLAKNWLNCIRDAIHNGYVVAGSYEKHDGMTVEKGEIKSYGKLITLDVSRWADGNRPVKCGGSWLFGCTLALPVEWAMLVDGYPTICDGIGAEDSLFGVLLENNGLPIFYDRRMLMIEDRTPSACRPTMEKTDKGVSPKDKSNALVAQLRDKKESIHAPWTIKLREIREHVQRGGRFPIPPKQTWLDWWDSSPINQL
jgi:hypothetical protein